MFAGPKRGPRLCIANQWGDRVIQQIAIIKSLAEAVRETDQTWKANLAGCLRDGKDTLESGSVKESFAHHTGAQAALLRALQFVVPSAPRKRTGENQAEANGRYLSEVFHAIVAEEDHMRWDWRPDTGGMYLHGVVKGGK